MKDSYGIYLHIPFCLQKCLYCDFCSHGGRTASEMYAYAEALCRELEALAPTVAGRTADSLFIGGGTPTLMPTDALLRILDCLHRHYDIEKTAEQTVEANPATLDAEKARALREAGLNRISIGMQSAHENELAALGRAHRASDLVQAVEAARAGGFTDINLDIMFGIPHQSPASFAATLESALALAPTHLSVYSLQIEEGTPFYERRDSLPLPNEDEEEEMQEILLRMMRQAGYTHYEISNFALPGHECRHNLRYWRREDYLGFGPAAHACIGNLRSYNRESLADYLQNPLSLRKTETEIDICEAEYETVMLGLRMREGIAEEEFARNFGEGFFARYGEVLRPYAEAGLVLHEAGRTSLTEKGMRLSNAILASLFASSAASHLFP